MTRQERVLRAAVIGAGPTTNLLHLPVLAGLRDRIELSVICDIKPELVSATRKKFGFREACGDAVAAIARADIDVVYVFGSAQMHDAYGRLAIQRGKHLFVEKPVAPSYARACELAQLARANGVFAVGGHNRRFHRSVDTVRAHGGATRFRLAEAVFHKPELGKPPQFGARTWLTANGIHALDALVYVMGGLPEELHAFAAGQIFSAVMRWRDGAQANFFCDNEAGERREAYAFHRPGESLTITERTLTIARKGAATRSPCPANDGFAGEHEAFLDAIRSGEGPRHAIDALAPSLYLAELIEDGHCGPVVLPQAVESETSRQAATPSILLVRSNGMEKPLGRLLGDYRLVTETDVATGARADVTAAILGDASAPLAGEVLDALPNLLLVGASALSVSRLDPEELNTRGIALANASMAYAESVAEFALGLAILGRRRAFQSHAAMQKGGWGTRSHGPLESMLQRMRRVRASVRGSRLEPLLVSAWRKAKPFVASGDTGEARDLKGATAGLIGWGANARAFAVRLAAAGVHVKVFSEHADPAVIRAGGAEPASLAEVLVADIVSLHRGLTARTRYFLGAAELALLQPGAVLINVARGALIEPDALYARLRKGDVFACLDTFEIEPPARRDHIRGLPNVFLTSHIAGGSRDMHAAAAAEVVQKVDAWLKGQAIETVSRARLETMS